MRSLHHFWKRWFSIVSILNPIAQAYRFPIDRTHKETPT
ncbi:hypothetical protein GLE_0567 [Lysobacter enzymogenes]|uniref:Uncharacterized protein n=1 Tax=Lysobacter enzymogenes TaxID=69 RepID=A0A0S2DBL7_LYSEN|nr:hypothetical protein GLE_0567 [Lysobacter enzymogenes]